jgi:hypothetical protein
MDAEVNTVLDTFYMQHRRCDDLDSDVEGDLVWLTCSGGAAISRTPESASASL